MKRHGTILEPFKDYEKKYQERLNCFIQNTKLDEPDFIYSELEHWERMVGFIDKIFYSENPDISIKTELLSKGGITPFDLPVNEENAKHPVLKSPLKIPSPIWGETEYHSKEWEELINFVCKETLEDPDLPLFTPDFVRNSVIHDFAAGKLEDYNGAAKRKIDFLKERKAEIPNPEQPKGKPRKKGLEPIKTILTIKNRIDLLTDIIHRKAEDIFDNKLNYNSLEEGRDREISKPVFGIIDYYKDYYSHKLGEELSNLFSFDIEYFRYTKGELIDKFREIEDLLNRKEDIYRPAGMRNELYFLLPLYTEIKFKLHDLKREVIDEFSPQIKYPKDEVKKPNFIPFEKGLADNKKEKLVKPPLTFESLFFGKENAQTVKDIFEQFHYTTKGKWQPNKQAYPVHSENKNELLAAYYVLKEKKGVLKEGKITTQARIFYNEFGLEVGKYISERMLRHRPDKDISKFGILFNSIE